MYFAGGMYPGTGDFLDGQTATRSCAAAYARKNLVVMPIREEIDLDDGFFPAAAAAAPTSAGTGTAAPAARTAARLVLGAARLVLNVVLDLYIFRALVTICTTMAAHPIGDSRRRAQEAGSRIRSSLESNHSLLHGSRGRFPARTGDH